MYFLSIWTSEVLSWWQHPGYSLWSFWPYMNYLHWYILMKIAKGIQSHPYCCHFFPLKATKCIPILQVLICVMGEDLCQSWLILRIPYPNLSLIYTNPQHQAIVTMIALSSPKSLLRVNISFRIIWPSKHANKGYDPT